MKKISRRSFITAMAAVSAAGVLAACGSSSSSTASSVASSAVSSEATSSAASMDETGTHTVVDHGGNEVEVPNKVTRVVIDQIPILSTYMAYFEGSAPYIVGYCGSFKSVISDTVLKNIAPELLESSDTVYAQSDLNIEEIMKLNPDVILYNAGNSSHAEILKASGIPSIGFATVGASTEADPIERYEEWLKLLEQIFNEPGKTDAFVAAGDEIVTDVEARIAEIPQTDRPSALILWKYADGVPQVSGQGTFGTYWMKRLGVTDKALEATGFAQASMEQIYSWDPDILFLDGPGLQPLRTEDVLSGNVDGADFSTLTAVKSDRVYNTTLGMLPERIIKIIVFIGDVQRMTGQMAQRDDFIAAFQQQFRDAHVQDGIGNAVVAGDEHQHFIVRSQGRQQSFALFFHGGGMAAHRHGTTEQSFGTKRFRDS